MNKLHLMSALAMACVMAAPAFASNAPCELIDKGGYKTWNNGACSSARTDNTASYVMGEDGNLHNDKSVDSKGAGKAKQD